MMPQEETFYEEKISETIGKPKDYENLDIPNKTVIANFNAIEWGNTLTRDTRSISKIFNNFFLKLVESLLI